MRALLHTLGALAAFVAVTSAVRAAVPWPAELGLGAKVEYFRDHRADFDALFVGSSRVFRGVVPRELERELAARGHELVAFNLGVGGMEDFEADHVLRAVLDDPGPRLAWVFVETGRWDPAPDDFGNTLTRRTIEWHTPTNLRNLLDALVVVDGPPLDRLREAQRHLGLTAMRLAAFGRGPEIAVELGLRAEPPTVDDRIQTEAELARDLGWQVMGEGGEGLEPAAWSRVVREIRRKEELGRHAGPGFRGTFPVGAVERQRDFLESRGLRVVYLTLPNSQGPVAARALDALGVFPTYLSYDLPSRYPKLYALDRRVDSNHLNERGARELTRLLAADVEELLEAE